MMDRYWDIVQRSFSGYANYLLHEVTHPDLGNYVYWLIALSLFVWFLEIVLPWRKKQAAFRKDFWLDAFYMFFNMFIFSLIGFSALANVGAALFDDMLSLFAIADPSLVEIGSWPAWLQLAALFVVTDFVQWNIHRLLHRVPFLWELHKLHHSVKEMGFAAHLRFHWMENIIYKSIQYVPLALIGFTVRDFLAVHIFAIFIGHLNHANLGWDYGPLKYVLNNPRMHIWHHAKKLPPQHRYGMNYGITLSVWDYLFASAYLPESGRDIELGFEGDEEFPADFLRQVRYPL